MLQSVAETLIFSKVLLPQGESLNIGKILHQEIDDTGKLIGIHNENNLLNTLAYDVDFRDGDVKRYGYNIIA